MHKHRLVLLTSLWKRHLLTDYVLSYYASIKKNIATRIHLELLCVGSEGSITRNIAERHGFKYVEFANTPLNYKWDRGILEAKQYNPDAIVIIGSDDLISEHYFSKVIEKIDFSQMTIHSLTDLYILNLKSNQMQHWVSASGKSMGLGRVIPRNVLEYMNWSLWSDQIPRNSGLDGSCVRKLRSRGIENKLYSMEDMGVDALDIKSDTNINSWKILGVNKLLTDKQLKKVLHRLSAEDIFKKIVGNTE